MQNLKTFWRMLCQLMKILNKKQRIQAVGVALMAMVVALLETLGISVVIPFILAMLQPEELMKNAVVSRIMKILGMSESRDILILTAILIIIVYILKNAFILLFNYIQSNFRNKLERDLSILMLRSYVYKPYSFHLNTNSAEIIRGITSDISGVAAIVDGYSSLLNEGLTCIMIGSILIALNPIMAIGLLALAAATALIIVVGLRKKISVCGKECRDAFAKRYQYAYQAINGIKEINVMKRQDDFLKYYRGASEKACENNTKYLWISKFPSRVIEVIFISGLLGMVCIFTGQNVNTSVLVAQFGTLAFASIRVLPAISSLATAMNSLVYNRPMLESAYQNIMTADKEKLPLDENGVKSITEKTEFQKELTVDHIDWRYTDSLPYVLKDLSLTIKKGESVGFIGESGAGKTTLADIILGLFEPQKGRIEVDGKNIFKEETNWAKIVGYVPQSVFLIDDTVRNNILFGLPETEADEDMIWKAAKQAQLEQFIKQLPKGLDTVLGERGVKISGGQRQRIAIARALYYNPDILVLDEATSALDTETENAVMESIEALQGHKTLIIVAHRLTTIAKCDKIFEIKNGAAVQKNKAEVLSTHKDGSK